MINAQKLRNIAKDKVRNILIQLEPDLIKIAEEGWLETTYKFPKLHNHEKENITRQLQTVGIKIEFMDNMNAIINWEEVPSQLSR